MERVNIPGVVGFYSRSAALKSGSSSMSENIKNLHISDSKVDSALGESTVHVQTEDTAQKSTDDCPDNDQSEHDENQHDEKQHENTNDGIQPSDAYDLPGDECLDSTVGCSDDEEGWINPENFEEACAEMDGVVEEEPVDVAVGCVTTDFAMQVCK